MHLKAAVIYCIPHSYVHEQPGAHIQSNCESTAEVIAAIASA